MWKTGLPSCMGRTRLSPEQIAAADEDPAPCSHTTEDTLDKVGIEAIVPTLYLAALQQPLSVHFRFRYSHVCLPTES